ncbi:unnamed protein product [Hymenolepis diminuta]|uniref:TATA-binding protein-associated factor n=1 Tax=Hymenolepis diminuta TaxID=6216 RepID=A0A3P6XWZ9_HYMDI|nr:unnamed protein product [Hymenolepis diminuta]
MDRLFALLESCPNETLRVTAARQLGELAQKAPEDVEIILTRLRGLLHNKSWRSRIAATEAIRSMIAHLSPWQPTPPTEPIKSEHDNTKVDEKLPSQQSSFLSLAGLNLDLVLENGARLYSMDLKEYTKDKSKAFKRPRKCGDSSNSKFILICWLIKTRHCCVPSFFNFYLVLEGSSTTITSVPSIDVLDRHELNRQLGLTGSGKAGTFLSTILESEPNTSISALISTVDLEDNADDIPNEMITDVMESVKQAYCNTNASVGCSTESTFLFEKATATALHTDWPLNSMCMRLLCDLWNFSWEVRHGAASGLRELLAFSQHTRHAGTKNGATEAENRTANRIYLEDVVVRVLCTLAVDQFSDFASDLVVAPVRQTAAQLLGVLCLHLDLEQIRLVVGHLLTLINLLGRYRQQCLQRSQQQRSQTRAQKRPAAPDVNWMVVHGGILGLNYVFSARKTQETSTLAGEEDLRCAACNALLELPRDILLEHGKAVGGPRLVDEVWGLLERSAGELSSATGPLLTLAAELIISSPNDVSQPDKCNQTADDDNQAINSAVSNNFANHVLLVLHFMHYRSSTELRRTAPNPTLDSTLLGVIFEQLFHRIILETDIATIQSVSDLWYRLVESMPVDLLVQATLNRIDFWLCQAMQSSSAPFADTMLHLLTHSVNQDNTQNYYIGGYEVGAAPERVRQNVALEARITATELLAYLSNRVCENQELTLSLAAPGSNSNSSASSSGDQSISKILMTARAYLVEHVVCGTHLRDRLGMQRFIGSLLLAAWPSPSKLGWPSETGMDLSDRMNNCLTNVVYFEEILGLFKTMNEDCHRLKALCEFTKLPVTIPPPKSGRAMNLVECQNLLQLVSSELPIYSPSTSTDEYFHLSEVDYQELQRALQKAQHSVSRCLALQLFWSSRVEVSLASALINFGWITPGRLTPLIRPLMDTIRVTSTTTSSLPTTDLDIDLPQVGENLRLQRLAAWNLARLLWTECQQLKQQCSSSSSASVASTSKALSKVSQNLAKYILPDEISDWGKYLFSTISTSNAASQASRKQSLNQLRRCGSLMALVDIIQTFLADSSQNVTLEEILPLKVPTIWEILWLEPLGVFRRIYGMPTPSTRSFSEDEKFLLEIKQDPTGLTSADLDVLYRSLYLFPPVLFSLQQSSFPDIPISHFTTGLIALATRCLRCKEYPCLRYAAAHNLGILVSVHAGFTVGVLNSLLTPIAVSKATFSDSDKLAILEATHHIIECVLMPRLENQVFHSLQLVSSDKPLSPTLHGIGFKETTGLLGKVSEEIKAPLHSLLSYVVVMLKSLVLPHFADPRNDVRLLASNIFTKLLILSPLEESAPDPACPGLANELQEIREEGRHFVQCLQRPKDIILYKSDKNIRAALRPYQQEGVNWLLFLKQYGLSGILADDLGLGKTLQTICALVNHHGKLNQRMFISPIKHSRRRANHKDNGISLVVCPATLCSHWQEEVLKFVPDRNILMPVIYAGNVDQRTGLQLSILERCNLLITTYEVVRADVEFFQQTFWEYIILDEGHIIRNTKSKISSAVKKLKARHRLILTGTPIQNRVNDLWSLFDFLMPGFLAPSETAFNSRFGRPILLTRDPKATPQLQRAGQKALDDLHRITMPFILRRMKEDVLQDLPPKVIQDYSCTMTPLQAKLYETFTSTPEGQEALNLALNKSIVDSEGVTSAKGSRGGFGSIKYLLAVCNHPCLVLTPKHPLYEWAVEQYSSSLDGLNDYRLSGKLIALKQLLLDCGFGDNRSGSASEDGETEDQGDLLRQHRALIFFQTKKMLNLVERLLNTEFKSMSHLRLDGSVPISSRQKLVNSFNSDPSIDALLLTTSVGGLGLNLTGADTVIFVEHDWNPCRDLQAMDRAHRIGQRKTVSVFRLVTTSGGSIEERIMSLQTFKKYLARTLVSAPENAALSSMNTSTLVENLAKVGNLGVLGNDTLGGGGNSGFSDIDAAANEYAMDTFDIDDFLIHFPQRNAES